MNVYDIKNENKIINISFNVAVIASKRCIERERILIISSSNVAPAESISKHTIALTIQCNVSILHFTEQSKRYRDLRYADEAKIVIGDGAIFVHSMYKVFSADGFDLIMFVHDGLDTDDGNYWMYKQLFNIWNLRCYTGRFVSISIVDPKNQQHENRQTIIKKLKEIQKRELITVKLTI